MKKTSVLAMSVLCAVASFGFVAEVNAETMRHDMDEVVIEGQKDVLPGGMVVAENRVGILGDIPVIEVPFTQRNYSQKTIENFADPNQPLNGILSANPSIRIGSPSPMYTDFNMRGINMNACHYSINNVPNMFNQTRNAPAYALESMDIISGPNTVLNGATFSNNGTNGKDAPAGLINVTTKKAGEEDLLRYTQRFSGKSNWTEEIDASHRFGEDKEWGVRVNGHQENGELSIDGAEVTDSSIYLNVDHKDDKSTTNIFGGYFDWKVEGGQRWLKAGGVTDLVDAVDGSNDLSFDGQVKQNHGYLMTINHKQELSDSWDAFVNLGMNHYNEQKIDPASGSLTLLNEGKLQGASRDRISESKGIYGQFGVTNETENDNVKNSMSFAVDYYQYKSKAQYVNNAVNNILGDIYSGVEITSSVVPAPSLSKIGFDKESGYALTLADRVEFGKASVFAALQYKDAETVAAKSGQKVSKDGINPTFAIAYAPVDNVSIYTSYAESYTKPIIVGGGYSNEGQIYDPIKNEQYEFGVKYENANLLHSIALFDLNQANFIDEKLDTPINGQKFKYSDQGENRFKGFEYSLSGKVADKWNLTGGFMYLDGKRENVSDDKKNDKDKSELNGKYACGVPDWNATIAAEYEADENNTVLAKLNYTGSSHVNDNDVKAPSFVTFDLGFKHETALGETPVTLRAMCYNLFGEDYWISRGNSVALGAPRTFMLSASFDI